MRKLLLAFAGLLAALVLGQAVVGAFQEHNARVAARAVRA
jgi:hypothetical protein